MLKELVQNADDACATGSYSHPPPSNTRPSCAKPILLFGRPQPLIYSPRCSPHLNLPVTSWSHTAVVKLCYDQRHHDASPDRLLYPGLAEFQGPALLAHNDALFSEEDFISITRIGDSGKEGKRAKVGRFGVGFNSVYHLTDLPSFVSGEHLVLFDPHLRHLRSSAGCEPGRRIKFTHKQAKTLLKGHPSSFSPYEIFDCAIPRPYSGTLFRFPLRTAKQAGASEVSSASYSDADVVKIIELFQAEAPNLLLFLRHVERIETYVWRRGANSPELVSSAHIRNICKKLREERALMSRLPTKGKSLPNSCLLRVTIHSSVDAQDTDWVIAQGFGLAHSKDLAESADMRQLGLTLLPWGGVACRLDPSQAPSPVEGQAFVFLPLPVRTGLPLHVNGFFEVSENRRDIWFGSDMQGAGKARSGMCMPRLQI